MRHLGIDGYTEIVRDLLATARDCATVWLRTTGSR